MTVARVEIPPTQTASRLRATAVRPPHEGEVDLKTVLAAAALFVAGCAEHRDMTMTMMAAADAGSPPLQLDLKGGSYLLLELTDGSMVSIRDGMVDGIVDGNGELLSCSELKMKLPALFQPSASRGPLLAGDCQLTR